jgi:hypothetical protein
MAEISGLGEKKKKRVVKMLLPRRGVKKWKWGMGVSVAFLVCFYQIALLVFKSVISLFIILFFPSIIH